MSQLSEQHGEARDRVYRTESARDWWIREQVEAFRESLKSDKKLIELEAAVTQAKQDELTTHRAAQEEIETEALTGRNSPYPLGTVMIEWKRQWGSRGYGRTNPWYETTGRTGVIEVITRQSKHQANLRWGKASLGSTVIRLRNKQRVPGIAYITMKSGIISRDGGFHSWFPENIDPRMEE